MKTRRPLEGIRVLELAQVVAGPFCGTLMAEFGAEVIKTEMPGKGDDLRRLGPSEDGVSYWFAADNRNKKLMTLDLRTPKGHEIVRRLGDVDRLHQAAAALLALRRPQVERHAPLAAMFGGAPGRDPRLAPRRSPHIV